MKRFLDGLAAGALGLLSGIVQKMPEGPASALGRMTGLLAFLFSKRRAVAYADLKSAFGRQYNEAQLRRIVREHYTHLGLMFIEILRLPALKGRDLRAFVRVNGLEHVLKLAREDSGVIYLTAHFGNWEYFQLATSHVEAPLRKPLRALARDQEKMPKTHEFMNRLRESAGFAVTEKGIGVRDLMRSLRRREWIGLLGDQDAGRDGGEILSFFGRKTTFPTGAFDLAQRTGGAVVPVFIARVPGGHEVFIEQPADCRESDDVREYVKDYVRNLEKHIRQYPSQWLWEVKRWKYSWTKRILILSDGKAGHVKQSEAVAAQFQAVEAQYGRPGMEYPLSTAEVRFRSPFMRFLFPFFAFFFIPFAQGRLGLLRPFFTKESFETILHASADFIISAGSSLVPLNLCLARDAKAKSIVLMKPSFPFNFFRYDLALVPAHDTGLVPRDAFRMLLAPSRMDPREWEDARGTLAREMPNPEALKVAVFVGGPTRRFSMDLEEIKDLFKALEAEAPSLGDYAVTTSRRTAFPAVQFLKNEVAHWKHCQKVVIATEDTRRQIVPGLMGLADILIVTEDSISMISEAVTAAKKVVVVEFAKGGLPRKHKKFQELLASEEAIVTTTPSGLREKLAGLRFRKSPEAVKKEKEALTRKLQEIL